ncbi:hypothetical protein M2105_000650 [Paenibacillus sp. PastF-1]|nr:hypothetical protein [Paenibacillus sp. PastF-2]MDF9846235.1 hypothetical protein [Paenibacillus sp. PastM-2]MDF9852808.1 hypothetical protein [Paenibacillus sp. PastF-1]MDH6477463.1 hypothetical protein [Paenibacillus sp. PastH-2]
MNSGYVSKCASWANLRHQRSRFAKNYPLVIKNKQTISAPTTVFLPVFLNKFALRTMYTFSTRTKRLHRPKLDRVAVLGFSVLRGTLSS